MPAIIAFPRSRPSTYLYTPHGARTWNLPAFLFLCSVCRQSLQTKQCRERIAPDTVLFRLSLKYSLVFRRAVSARYFRHTSFKGGEGDLNVLRGFRFVETAEGDHVAVAYRRP